MDVDSRAIKLYAGEKPDLPLGKVERTWASAVGSGVHVCRSLGTRQVEMGSSRWPETQEKCSGSSVR